MLHFKNILLHFLNSETQKIFGIQSEIYFNALEKAFRIAILLSNEYSFIPLGFYFESVLSKKLLDKYWRLFQSGHLKFSLYEISIEDFIYKKQLLYEDYKDIATYHSFYNDKYFEPITKRPINIINRTSRIGNYCLSKWLGIEKLLNNNEELFQYNVFNSLFDKISNNTIKKNTINLLLRNFSDDKKSPFIWKRLTKSINPILNKMEFYDFYKTANIVFEHFYYEIYLNEYSASILYDLPFDKNIHFNFQEQWSPAVSYSWYTTLLEYLGILTDIFKCNPESLISFKESKYKYDIDLFYSEICQLVTSKNRDSFRDFKNLLFSSEICEGLNESIAGAKSILNRKKYKELYYMKVKTCFIVHGQDEISKLQLKDYLQNTLKFKAIVLADQPNGGKTIIEKFEYYADQSNIVFVLLTPDDKFDNTVRARQNVIFELGYFLGKLGRKSGKIILLYKGNLELPSDISGITYICIDNGIISAGEQIRKEVCDL